METISRYLLTFLLNSLWQVSLVAAVAALASRVMLNGPARYRHAVWVTALLAGILLPLASVRKSEQATPVRITVSYVAAPDAPLVPSESTEAATHARRAQVPTTWAVPLGQTAGSVLVGVYLLFLAFRFGKLVWAWMRTVQIRQTASARSTPPTLEAVWTRGLKALI